LGGYGLAYNTDAVTEEDAKLLTNWSTAFDERFAGRIGIPDPNFVGGFVNNLWMLKQNLPAPEYTAMLTKLGALKPRTFESTVPMNSALAAGDIAVGWSYDGTLSSQISAGAPIAVSFVEPQPVMFTLIGILEPSKNPEAARLFLDWFTSSEGQTAWANAYGTLPANPNASDGRPMVNKQWYRAPKNLVYLTEIPTPEQRAELLKEFNTLVLGR
jgi:iron(III) transport system substrate-binding protein